MKALVLVALLAGCTQVGTNPPNDPPNDPPATREHDERFIGVWAVEQPLHALYEVTYYAFDADGSLHDLASEPANCSGHLSKHCVTGSVASGETSCVFGDEWFSRGSSKLVVVGACSDQVDREIVIEMAADASSNTGFGGAGGTLISVGGEAGWTHDNFDWAFRRCTSSDLSACSQSPF